MKGVKVIKDPEAFQLLADNTRRRIMHLLRAKERTVSQISEELGLTPQAIYHHVRKMRDADLIEVAREERVDHFIETYYRATAEVFQFSHGEGHSGRLEEQHSTEALQNLSRLGLNVSSDPNTASKIVAIDKKMAKICRRSEIADKVANLEGIELIASETLIEYGCLLSMTDDEFDEYLNLQREVRNLLRRSTPAA
jgi:DNA-binding transcriptional ArsR family regulator